MIAHDENSDTLLVTGIVMPAERDTHGNVVGLVIETEEFETFVIESTKSNEGLFELMNEKVRVKGKIRGKDNHGNPVLKVEIFELAE
jgi:hypothetical protein